jgi:uncharacterized DUF497 family protein
MRSTASAIVRLTDIIEAIDHIHSTTAGITLNAFERSWEKRWLVERGIEIISEASRRLPERYGMIGMVENHLLFIAYTMRGERIRIISARKAQPYERRKYHDENQQA